MAHVKLSAGELVTHLRLLAKSADYLVRERAEELLDEVEKGSLRPGQRFRHGWIPIGSAHPVTGMHPDEGPEVHDHLDRAHQAMQDHATAVARGHVSEATAAAKHPRTRRAIRRYVREHIQPFEPGGAQDQQRHPADADRDILSHLRRA